MQYALIEEAWCTGTPPPMMVRDDKLFDVGKFGSRAPVCDGDSFEKAIETAYPPTDGEAYERSFGSRTSSTLPGHAPAPGVCPDAPRGRAGGGDGRGDGRTEHQSQTGQARGGSAGDAKVAEQNALYDLILFCLSGILVVLVLDQFVTIGQTIAMTRATMASRMA